MTVRNNVTIATPTAIKTKILMGVGDPSQVVSQSGTGAGGEVNAESIAILVPKGGMSAKPVDIVRVTNPMTI
jgi:hypothetical protein